MKTVLLFGTFDGLHPGHLSMLRQAWRYGDKIVVALPPDSLVKLLKGHQTKYSYEKRETALEDSGLVDEVVKGDDLPGVYNVLSEVKPDIIAFGYDQLELKNSLLAFLAKTGKSIENVTLQAFEPEIYKSSYDRS